MMRMKIREYSNQCSELVFHNVVTAWASVCDRPIFLHRSHVFRVNSIRVPSLATFPSLSETRARVYDFGVRP